MHNTARDICIRFAFWNGQDLVDFTHTSMREAKEAGDGDFLSKSWRCQICYNWSKNDSMP